MNIQMKTILAIIFLISISSCATKKAIYRANNSKRIIIVENDSIIRYTELVGCLGNSNALKYKIEDSLLTVSGNANTTQEGIFSLATDLYGSELIMQTDSLIVKHTGEIFYTDKFLKSKPDKQFQEFYIVLDNRKQKITKSNFKRILTNPDLVNYTTVEMDKGDAEKKYGTYQGIRQRVLSG